MKRYFYKAGEIIEYSESQITYQDEKGNSNVKVLCGKCGGSGRLSCYAHVDGGICFKCEGVGHFTKSLKLRDLEEAEKLQSKYLAKKEQEKQNKRAEQMQEFLEQYSRLTDMYVVYKNSYQHKDYLKAIGYKFDPSLKSWYGSQEPELEDGFVKISKEDFYKVNEEWLHVSLDLDNILNIIKNENRVVSNYYGEVGNSYEETLKVEKIKIIEGQYSSHLVVLTYGEYKFNCFTNAYKVLDNIEEGYEYKFSFTIKKQDEYNGNKINYITKIKLK